MHAIETPVGTLFACAGDRGLFRLDYHNADIPTGNNYYIDQITDELASYFRGELKKFATPIDPQGTDFQKSVWSELLKIPYGETITYAQLAERLGNPPAIRAVAAANGSNFLSIIIPCHRVIASGGDLQGYRGGLIAKRFLIDHERGQAQLF
jgi:methylated-DNA-[protein]-cysteine S-methyltransferase